MPGLVSGLDALLAGRHPHGVRSPWQPLTAMALVVAILAVALIAGDLITSLLASRIGGAQPTPGLPIALLLVPQSIAILLAVGASRLRGPLQSTLALRRTPSVTTIARSFVPLVAGLAALALALHVLVRADIFADLRPFVPIARSDTVWLLLLAAVVGAPLAEEIVFRGILLPALARTRLGLSGAAVVSSACWTGLHFTYSWLGIGAVFLIGLYLSALLWRTGSLWATIACHALYNLSLIAAVRLIDLPQPA